MAGPGLRLAVCSVTPVTASLPPALEHLHPRHTGAVAGQRDHLRMGKQSPGELKGPLGSSWGHWGYTQPANPPQSHLGKS